MLSNIFNVLLVMSVILMSGSVGAVSHDYEPDFLKCETSFEGFHSAACILGVCREAVDDGFILGDFTIQHGGGATCTALYEMGKGNEILFAVSDYPRGIEAPGLPWGRRIW